MARKKPTLQLFRELQRRNVFRVAIGYIVSCWLLIQVADLVLENIGAPDWVMQTIMLLLSLGFPVVVFFSWAYEVTPEGIRRESEVDRSHSITHITGRKLDRAIVAVLVFAVAYFAFDKFVLDPRRDAELVEGLRQSMAEEPGDQAAPAPIEENSIAVLPFLNMSSDADNEYFSDGITEELLNALSKIPELRVISRTSAFSFKGQNIDVPTLAAQLNVAHVLEGSVRKSGNKVRITAQLIDAGADQHLWSETYDRELDDIFAVQDEISRKVVEALHIRLLGEAPTVSVTDTEAYTLYLKGKHFEALSTPENWKIAEDTYRQAIAIDPGFAPAWSGLSYVLRSQANLSFIELHEGTEEAREAAIHAIELDDSLGEAWAALAEIQFTYDWDWDRAEGTIRTALQYGSGNIFVLKNAAQIMRGLGRPEEALKFATHAVEIDPLSRVALRALAITQYFSHRFHEAEETLRHVLDLYPEQVDEKAFLANLMLRHGKPEEALAYLNTTSDNFWHRIVHVSALWDLGRTAESNRLLQALIDDFSIGAAYQFAQEFAFRNDPEEAFRWLDIAIEQRDGGIAMLILDPILEILHEDPRWEEYVDRVGLLKYWREYQASETGA